MCCLFSSLFPHQPVRVLRGKIPRKNHHHRAHNTEKVGGNCLTWKVDGRPRPATGVQVLLRSRTWRWHVCVCYDGGNGRHTWTWQHLVLRWRHIITEFSDPGKLARARGKNYFSGEKLSHVERARKNFVFSQFL